MGTSLKTFCPSSPDAQLNYSITPNYHHLMLAHFNYSAILASPDAQCRFTWESDLELHDKRTHSTVLWFPPIFYSSLTRETQVITLSLLHHFGWHLRHEKDCVYCSHWFWSISYMQTVRAPCKSSKINNSCTIHLSSVDSGTFVH